MITPADGAWLAQQRVEKLQRENPIPTAPTFIPSVADLAALPPGPDVTPEQRQSALKFLGAAENSTRQTVSTPIWPPVSIAPPTSPSGMRLNLPKESEGSGKLPWGTRPAPNPIADSFRGKIAAGIGDAAGAGFETLATAGAYLGWVRMAKYPWFWGPINGLKDVEYMLSVTLDVYMKSRWLPDYTKGLAAGNISEAMNWVREQRARQAATSGGEPVAH